MAQFGPGKSQGNETNNQTSSAHQETAKLPGGRTGNFVGEDQKAEFTGRLLERFISDPNERQGINEILNSPDSPLGAESSSTLARFHAISVRTNFIQDFGSPNVDAEPKVLRQVAGELVDIARNECSPEEREAIVAYTRHMARWLANDEGKAAAERVQKLVGEIGKNEVAGHIIQVGYAINDTKAAIKEGFENTVSAVNHAKEAVVTGVTVTVEKTTIAVETAKVVVAEKTAEVVDNTGKAFNHAKETISNKVSETVEATAQAIDDAKKAVAEKLSEAAENIVKGGQTLWSNIVDACTKAWENTKNVIGAIWEKAVGAAKDFVGVIKDKWEDATAFSTNVMLDVGRAIKSGAHSVSEAVTNAYKAVTGAIGSVYDWVVGNEPRNVASENAAVKAWKDLDLNISQKVGISGERWETLRKEEVIDGLAALLGRRYSEKTTESGGWAEVRKDLSDREWGYRRTMATAHLMATEKGAEKLVEILDRSHGFDGRFDGALDTKGLIDVLHGIGVYIGNQVKSGGPDAYPNIEGVEKVLDALGKHTDRIQDIQVRAEVKQTLYTAEGSLREFRSNRR